MTAKKPSQSEEEYIVQQEALGRHKAAVEKHEAMRVEEQERLRLLHHMKCPKCGMDLESTMFRGATIEKCHYCNGTWLDAGELESLAGKGEGVLNHLVDLFRRPQR